MCLSGVLLATVSLALSPQATALAADTGQPVAAVASEATWAQDYFKRFNAMVAELAAHPRTRVTHLWVGRPVTDAQVAAVEVRLGRPLEPALLAFFRRANGLQLRWIDTESPEYRPGRDDRTITRRQSYIAGDNDDANGVIDIAPLEEIFAGSEATKGQLWWDDSEVYDEQEFAGRSYPYLAFRKALRPFDRFSFYNSAGFFIADGEEQLTVIIGDDHDACWTDSRRTDFRSYVEHALSERGTVQARRDWLGTYAGHRQPALRVSATARPPLTALLPPTLDVVAGTRVIITDQAHGSSDVRATVVRRANGLRAPRTWRSGTRFLELQTDLGDRVFFHGRPRIVATGSDPYEQAAAAPERFFAALAGAPIDVRVDMLNAVATRSNTTMVESLKERPSRGVARTHRLMLDNHAWRYAALTARLPAERAVTHWAKVLGDLGAAAATNESRQTDVIRLGLGALLIELRRAEAGAGASNTALKRVRERAAKQTERLLAPLAAAAGDESITANLALLRSVLAGRVDFAKAPIRATTDGSAFGLEPLRVVSN